MDKEKLINLVTRAQSGDANALDSLFTEFYNDVYYFALKTVKDSDTACDITQETFLEIIRTIGSLKEPVAFVTWMKQITYHKCTRYFSRKKDVLVEEDEDGNTVFDSLPDEGALPTEVLEQAEFRQTILHMIDQLTEEQRSAVMLYYFDELTVAQIAQIQSVSEGTVKSRLNYARKAIRKSVEDYEKKTGTKLHSIAFLPLFLLGFGKEVMPAAKVTQVRTAVAAAAKSAGGVVAKVLVGKIVAGVIAAAVVVGAGMLIFKPKPEPTPTAPQQTTAGEYGEVVVPVEPAETYLVEQVFTTGWNTIYRNEEGLITSFESGVKAEYFCEYDADGNLTKISKFTFYQPAGSDRHYSETPEDVWIFTYDEEGNLVQYLHGEDDPWTYSYDASGRLATIHLYGDVEVRYVYDAQNRVTAKQMWNNGKLTDEDRFQYGEAGKLIQYHVLSGIDTRFFNETYYDYSYDNTGAVASYTMKWVSGDRVNEQTVICENDENGCMVSQTFDGLTTKCKFQYAAMELTPEQAARARGNTEFILSFCNKIPMPNAIHVEQLR